MSNQGRPGRVFFSPADQDTNEISARGSRDAINFGNNPISVPLEEAHFNLLNDVSSFRVPSSLSFQQADSTEIQGLQEIAGRSLEKGQSSGTKRKHASEPLDMQNMESQDEAGVEGGLEKSHKCKQRRARSSEAKNLKKRLRRQKLNEKMKALKDLIPNCNKRDIVSAVDGAIMNINTIQYQMQEQQMWIQACYSMFHSSSMMMIPQPRQQEMQIPCLAPFQQADLIRSGIGTRMGMPGMFPTFNFPMSQLRLLNPHLLTSLASSGLPSLGGTSASNPGNVLEPLPSATSSMGLATLSATSSGFQCTTVEETSLAQGAPSTRTEMSDNPCDK